VRQRNVVLGFVAVVVAVGLAGGLFLAGLSLGGHTSSRNLLREQLPSRVSQALFGPSNLFPLQQEVLESLRTSYYRDVDPKTLEDDTIRGMLAGLDDPYTNYFDPKEFASFQEHTEGQYSGLGMVVEMKDGFVTVVSTFGDSPAEKAGIVPGDLIISVDGKTTRGVSLDEVVDRIKGPAGTKIKLETYRLAPGTTTTSAPEAPEDEGAPLHLPEGGTAQDLELERQAIVVPVVETEDRTVEGQPVRYIRFTTFTEGSSGELRKAVDDAVDDGVSAIILDLRANGGGLLTEAVHVASIFVPEGVITTTEGLHSPKEVFRAEGRAVTEKMPLYVLVDGYSASAAEIVAGALKDTDRATLVGEQTFGKGLVQTVEPLSNGGALKLTSAVYLTPDGNDINKKGIAPDVKAPDKPDTEADETLDKTLELIASAR
jgi:carboxyl-terminal processing protease